MKEGARGISESRLDRAGVAGELETEVEICMRNSFMSRDAGQKVLTLNDRVGAMLFRLDESLD